MSNPTWANSGMGSGVVSADGNSGKPDWLADTDNNVADLELSEGGGKNWEQEVPKPPEAVKTDFENDDEPDNKIGCCVKLSALISFLFLGLFVASAYFQQNDREINNGWGLQWMIFYCVHASVAALSILFRVCCGGKGEGMVASLAGTATTWSIVLAVWTGIEYSKTDSGGPTEGGDNDDWTEKEEKAYEVAGACVGILSGFYHGLLFKCCSARKD